LTGSYFGGAKDDAATDVLTTQDGSVIGGVTASDDFARRIGLRSRIRGASDGFVVALRRGERRIAGGQLVGGAKEDIVNGLAIQGNQIAVGGTSTGLTELAPFAGDLRPRPDGRITGFAAIFSDTGPAAGGDGTFRRGICRGNGYRHDWQDFPRCGNARPIGQTLRWRALADQVRRTP
jgi:hypothetical protein